MFHANKDPRNPSRGVGYDVELPPKTKYMGDEGF